VLTTTSFVFRVSADRGEVLDHCVRGSTKSRAFFCWTVRMGSHINTWHPHSSPLRHFNSFKTTSTLHWKRADVSKLGNKFCANGKKHSARKSFYILEIHSGLLHIVYRSARLTIWSSPECRSNTAFDICTAGLSTPQHWTSAKTSGSHLEWWLYPR